MSESPVVTRLVMYKHGMALVERSGPVDGDFALTFRQTQMKDVLKSLSVSGTGTELAIGAVSFDTPTDPHSQLGLGGKIIDSGNALRGLFDGLRGRTVDVDCDGTHHRGEVIGVDESAKYRQMLVLRELDKLDKRGAEYPAEHNVGHLYQAKPELAEFYRGLDPTNSLNPGIGQTSKCAHWH